MHRHAMVLLAMLILGSNSAMVGCGGDDDSSSTPDAMSVADAAPVVPDAAASSAQCYPTGIYGKCAETGCGNCLAGASIYSVCSASCTTATDCGSASDFSGATPLCAPLNPGDSNMICVLTCTAQEQCPCGLECRESGVQGVKICAETL